MESYSKTHHAFDHCQVGTDFADSLTVHHSLGILIFQVSLTGEEGGGGNPERGWSQYYSLGGTYFRGIHRDVRVLPRQILRQWVGVVCDHIN